MDGRATMRAESAIPSSVGGFGARLWRPRHRDECGPPGSLTPGPGPQEGSVGAVSDHHRSGAGRTKSGSDGNTSEATALPRA